MKPGEIRAVAGTPAVRRRTLARIAADAEAAGMKVAALDFSQQAGIAQGVGWTQARYYSDEGKTVAEFLSFNDVHEVNPFEMGAKRSETRMAFAGRMKEISRILEIEGLRRRPLAALSNGETRRVLLARALAKKPDLLVLDDPAAGMDVRQRGKLREILSALAKRGLAIAAAFRHEDERPGGEGEFVSTQRRGEKTQGRGEFLFSSRKKGLCASAELCASALKKSENTLPPPVIELRGLNASFGGRRLFRDFAWTVRRGERWLLRGENGSGKTTLLAVLTGDSPLGYASDLRVFGIPRGAGGDLASVRRRIASVSPERQACHGETPEEALDAALSSGAELLLLDEPFMNAEPAAARRMARRISSHLRANPGVTAILVCHREDEAPACFDKTLDLG